MDIILLIINNINHNKSNITMKIIIKYSKIICIISITTRNIIRQIIKKIWEVNKEVEEEVDHNSLITMIKLIMTNRSINKCIIHLKF